MATGSLPPPRPSSTPPSSRRLRRNCRPSRDFARSGSSATCSKSPPVPSVAKPRS